MIDGLHDLVVSRSRGVCECGCRRPLRGRGEADHFFGRAKAPEDREHVWLLLPECHRDKTDNRPSKTIWLHRFMAHCGKHGYAAAAVLVQQKLDWDQALNATKHPRA